MKNLLVCSNSTKGLKKINENVNGEQKYYLEGVFAELDTLNRNKRIYPKDEYLKHLAYLRDDIKSGEPLLGELDHPDDRFEVKLKEASHRIVDLWYDADTNTVRGKVELLNTPNGKLAQSLVDQGIPLHISSRAAGTVGNDNKVSIQQIYTYDLVCKPGFAGAVLHRVNESDNVEKYSESANNFLKKAVRSEAANAAAQFGFVNEEFSIREVDYDVKPRKEIENIKENDTDENMDNKKVAETDLEKEEVVATEEAKKDKKPQLKSVFEEGEENPDDKDSEGASSEEGGEGSGDGEGEGSSEDGGEDSEEGVKIISVDVETSDDEEGKGDEEGVDVKDVDKEDGDGEGKGSEDGDGEGEDEKKDDENSADEAKTDECGDNEGKGCDGKKCDPEKDALFDCKDLKDKKEKTLDKIDELIDTIKKKKDECKSNESVTINKYPKSAMLNESNFQEFMKLDESQKSNVIAYLNDNGKYTPESINESWKNGINYEQQEVWLKYAPANYKELFENASDAVKRSIRNTAKYLIFESKSDINSFWENTGLMERQYSQSLNEKFINTMPRIVESAEPENKLPYSQEFIDVVTEMACAYNS